MTPLGVCCHELGHHWHFFHGPKEVIQVWKQWIGDEKPVSSYGETSTGEDIAEAFKLFVDNPTLLRDLWPNRYAMFASCLIPVEPRHWREILAGSPRHIRVVERKLR
jgi:hypothetical protein